MPGSSLWYLVATLSDGLIYVDRAPSVFDVTYVSTKISAVHLRRLTKIIPEWSDLPGQKLYMYIFRIVVCLYLVRIVVPAISGNVIWPSTNVAIWIWMFFDNIIGFTSDHVNGCVVYILITTDDILRRVCERFNF